MADNYWDPDSEEAARLGVADLPNKPRYPFDPDPNEDPMTAPRGYGPTIAESTMFDPGTFDRRWQTRGGAPALSATARMGGEKTERAQDITAFHTPDAVPRQGGDWYAPSRPDQAGRWTDERGVSGPELDLQARFLHSRGVYDKNWKDYPGGYPIPKEHWSMNKGGYYSEDVPVTGEAAPEMRGDLPTGAMTEDKMRHYMIQHQLKGKFSPNSTPLDDANDFIRYMQWAQAGGKNPFEEEHDYDLRGYYKAGGTLDKDAHLPDTFKKPNHPTFSDESKYSGPGQEGGHWTTDKKGNYVGFTAGPGNLQYHTPADMQKYFDKYEPGIQLHFPPGTPGVPDSFKDRYPEGMMMEQPIPKKKVQK
jgi:hypothetical protein